MKFYKCTGCSKLLSVIDDAKCTPRCCGEPMIELQANTTDGAKEKHVPVYEVKDGRVSVTVGSVEHPMMEAHYIQWIAIETTQGRQRKTLTPEDKPAAEFALVEGEKLLAVYEYCNLHGLWKTEL